VEHDGCLRSGADLLQKGLRHSETDYAERESIQSVDAQRGAETCKTQCLEFTILLLIDTSVLDNVGMVVVIVA
jgi:hypothetical protein